MKIKGLEFEETCYCSPEQYDVFDENGTQVGYVRLRWGGLRCNYPDCGGEEIYYADVGDGWTGRFPTEQDRAYHLTKIATKILARINQERDFMDEDDRKEAIRYVMSQLGDGYLDLDRTTHSDRDAITIVKEAMSLLMEEEFK